MRNLFNKAIRFFTSMESTSQKAVWIAFALFSVAGLVLAFGMMFLDVNQGAVADFLRAMRSEWWAPIAVTLVFTILAFLGAPQFVLIAATVAVFGASEGIIMSWIATMVSAITGYVLGRIGGASAVQKLLSGRGAKLLRFIGKNGFITSLLVRQVPTGPFVLVNLALGASNVRSSWFIAGTGIGILPKIFLIAFGAHGIGQALKGENLNAILFFILAGVIWAIIVFLVRPILLARQNSSNEDIPE